MEKKNEVNQTKRKIEMKYKGIELNVFESEKPVLFDSPKLMLVWNDADSEPSKDYVFAFIPNRCYPVIGTNDSLDHCAEIPEVMCRRVTNRELAKWIAQGNGQCYMSGGRIWTEYNYDIEQDDDACSEFVKVRKWCDKEWHEPTLDYLGLEESK